MGPDLPGHAGGPSPEQGLGGTVGSWALNQGQGPGVLAPELEKGPLLPVRPQGPQVSQAPLAPGPRRRQLQGCGEGDGRWW